MLQTLECRVQAVWTLEQAEKVLAEFAAGASRAMLFMRSLSAVALWRWPKDHSSATPLQHVCFQARSPLRAPLLALHWLIAQAFISLLKSGALGC